MEPVFSILPLSPENFCNKFTYILLFFSTFFGQISCRISKNNSLFKKSMHFSMRIYIFYILRFVVLEIFDFKVFDIVEKINENATLKSNIAKVIRVLR